MTEDEERELLEFILERIRRREEEDEMFRKMMEEEE